VSLSLNSRCLWKVRPKNTMFGAVKSPTGFHLDDDEKKLKKMGILDSPRQRPYGYRPKRVFFPMSMVTRRTLTVGVIASFILFIFLSSHGTFSHHPPSQSPYHGHSSGHSFGSSDGKYPASGSKGSRHGASTPGTLATAPGTAPPPLPQEEEQDAFARLMNFTVTDRPVMVDDPLCEGFPDIGNIAVIMKTGASESFGKIPTQLLTTMRCVPELLIFSDKEETIAGVKIRNALDNMLPEAQKNNGEFDLYRAQRDCLVDQEHCTKHIKNKGDAGWNLDKYKNIHMAEKTWKLRPGRDWYFFIDADTYVLWNTLVLWLQKLDPARKHYLGNIALIQDFAFAHGGSGYLLSRPALAELVAKNPGVAHEYDVLMKDVCCGDYMFSRAMKEKTGIAAVQVVSEFFISILFCIFFHIPLSPCAVLYPSPTHLLTRKETPANKASCLVAHPQPRILLVRPIRPLALVQPHGHPPPHVGRGSLAHVGVGNQALRDALLARQPGPHPPQGHLPRLRRGSHGHPAAARLGQPVGRPRLLRRARRGQVARRLVRGGEKRAQERRGLQEGVRGEQGLLPVELGGGAVRYQLDVPGGQSDGAG